jgi:indole-3-glycerol phosphate synthase
MRSILTQIVIDQRKEIVLKKAIFPIAQLQTMPLYSRQTISFADGIKNTPLGIIAEHKRRSPSKPQIKLQSRVAAAAAGYEQAGVAAMSVLTNSQYFGGSLEDLVLARAVSKLPLLRKEFIVDNYQVHEAKAYGADAILLIAACLSAEETNQLAKTAKDIGLDVLLEVHNLEELEQAPLIYVDVVGVNNRNLKDFSVDLNKSITLAAHIPSDKVKISESGISSYDAIEKLMQASFDGFLIGEYFMLQDNPGEAAQRFIQNFES